MSIDVSDGTAAAAGVIWLMAVLLVAASQSVSHAAVGLFVWLFGGISWPLILPFLKKVYS